jgi:exopolyphosphatase/pppGpp-phosphohydrolase
MQPVQPKEAVGVCTISQIDAPQEGSPASKATVVRRAGFDLGSGMFKLMVADVDLSQSSTKIQYTKMISVRLGEYFNESTDKSLNKEVQEKAKKAICELLKDAQGLKATEVAGVCTAVFRKASNGAELLQALNGIMNEQYASSSPTSQSRIQLVSGEIEGMLGFQTAAALHSAKASKDIVSFDCGNGSFQIARKKDDKAFDVYEGQFGCSGATKAFLEEVRKIPYTKENPINPVTQDEINTLVHVLKCKLDLPEWLKDKLANAETRVVGFGDSEAIFAMVAKTLEKTNFTLEEVKEVLKKFAEKTAKDEAITKITDEHQSVAIKVALLTAVMEKFGIQSMHYEQTMGSIPGLLISKEFWPVV